MLAALCYVVSLCIYRLWLSPLSRFPGPKLAALTFWYEFYYDIVKDGGGLYIWEVQKMHRQYGKRTSCCPSQVLITRRPRTGPIVRVNPYEIHVNDPEFFNEIYASSSRPRNKYEWHSKSSTSQLSFAFTPEHSLHRLRREPLNAYFSKRSIMGLEPMIAQKVERLCVRLEQHRESGVPVNLSSAFTALTVDIISECCYADSFNYLDQDEFASEWRDTVMRRMRSMKLVSHLPIVMVLLRYIPSAWTAAIVGDVSAAVNHRLVSVV